MTYSFNPAIPQPNGIPSDDQNDILTNFSSTNGILAVDHVGFNASGGGTHKQMQINAPLGSDPTRTGTQAAYYTKDGTATNSIANAYFNTGVGVYNLNLIKAYGIVNSSGFVGSQQMNCSSSWNSGTNTYTITVTSGIITGTNFLPIAVNLSSTGNTIDVTITSAGVFTFSGAPVSGATVGFIVLQL